MQTLTPAPHIPANTLSLASAALKRLGELSAALATELKALPIPPEALLNAIASADSTQRESQVLSLLQQINGYWDAPSATGERRYDKFLAGLKQALRDEVSVKIHERDLEPAYADCLPVSPGRSENPSQPTTQHFSLQVQLHDDELADIAGALVMSQAQGHTLLVLPGLGATGFASRAALRETLAQWLNDPQFNEVLFNNLALRHQDRLAAISQDADLHLEPFTDSDVQLQALTGDPYIHAFDSLLGKQREDIRYACAEAAKVPAQTRRALIQNAIAMHGRFGPVAMLQWRELANLEARYRQSLPDWIKIASKQDLNDYAERLRHYDEARAALLSALGAAASPEQFADVNLRTRMADDLGIELDPGAIRVSTERTLPLTGETYTVSRSLVELALYGLHPGDGEPGSDFLTHTTLSLDGAPLQADDSSLTPAYIAEVINELDLRVTFGAFQRKTYDKAHNRQLMHDLTRRQMSALAYAAKMQGRIQPGDFDIFEAASAATRGAADPTLRVQQIKLNSRHVMGKLLVIRKETALGQLDRLVLVAADAPSQKAFMAFNNEARLVHELVSWAGSDELRQYLIKQVETSARPELEQQLTALSLKPYPADDFLQLIDLTDYDAGLRTLTEAHVRVALSEQASHTPDWYLQASAAQRQELVALEDAAAGALKNYDTKLHTRVQPFKDYVHERASQQISQLLNVPAGTVDPDLIVITSERETVSYTDMLLNGYDDGLDFIHTSADTQATFSGPEGVNLSALSPGKVAGSVRGKWLGDDYIALISRTLLAADGEGYDYRRNTNLLIAQLQMKAAALRSCLKGQVSEQQYAWLKDSIERAHLSDPESREQYPLYPLQIHVDKPFISSGLKGADQLVIPSTQLTHVETVQGCLVILPTTNRQPALLYTPQAPDGVEFRLFGDFTISLGAAGMIDYYKDRCRIKARKALSFFLHDMLQGKAHKPPFIPKAFIADFAGTCFNRPIERKLRDVKETTTGRNDMLYRVIWSSVEIIATVVTLPFPPASFAVGALLSLHDSVRALQALREGDSEAAGAYVLSSLLNSLGAVGDLHSGLKGFGGLLHRIDRAPHGNATRPPLLHPSSLPRYEDLYPVRVQNEPFLVGKPNANGQAPVYRSVGHSTREVKPTGQFATRKADGTWQPSDASAATSSTLTTGARQELAVNVSLQDMPRLSEGHSKGICRLGGKHYVELSGKTYQVHFDPSLRCWQIVDPANPFAFFGKQPVRLDDQGKWQLIDRHQLRGGGLDGSPGYQPLTEEAAGSSTTVANLADYQLPAPLQPHLNVILSDTPYDPTGIGIAEYFESYFAEMRQTFTTLREKLYRDADTFFVQPPLAARPPVPATPPAALDTLIQEVFSHSNGLVLSEAPKSVASKRLLILNMPLLAEQRVEVLYIEHLFTDKHMNKLARYRQLGKKSRAGSHEIKHHLESLNSGALDNQTTEYDYYHVVKAAHRHGIEVRPLNSSISYPFADHPVAAAANDATATQKMSLFFGHKVISHDVAAEPSRRWIALLDQQLATTHGALPGIAELEGAISVHIKDIPAGRTTRVSTGASAVDATTRTDFTVELANPVMIVPTTPLPASTPLDLGLMREMGSTQNIAAGELWGGEYGFRWDNTDGWSRIEPENWTANPPSTAIQQSIVDAAYEMPTENAGLLHDLATFKKGGLHESYFFNNVEITKVRESFFTRRRQLQRDARSIVSAELPVRPTLPDVDPRTSLSDFLHTLYQHTDGVVIGESHFSIASKKLIIDNLGLLSEQNVKTVYLEHLLADLHQADLDRFFETGQMSKTLLHDLRYLDKGHQTDPARIYNFEQLVIRTREHGLEVRAIDCSTSYHLKGISDEAPTTRQQMMNYFASRTIGKHQEVVGSRKWIALVGNSHSNTFEGIVPGLAELQGGIGLRVNDVMPGQSKGVIRDPGESVRVGITDRKVAIKGDYLVELEVRRPVISVRPPQALPVEERLSRPGKFLIEQDTSGGQTIVHRSRDSRIHRTPVLVDPKDQVYVDRPTWTAVHLTPYDNMDALVAALEELNLTRVAR
ncbi:dermonecrotic toxin domain-containing protein [Pseudomonas sp. DWP3-1-2]|uniref:dermonecrotic toxin domain-containing protein n=1 Tax=Pseudomonas sp. DWP3-1-2 TaxID=2804645 RepID=UPI003CF1A226